MTCKKVRHIERSEISHDLCEECMCRQFFGEIFIVENYVLFCDK